MLAIRREWELEVEPVLRREWEREVEPVLRRERNLGQQQKFIRPLPDKLQTPNRRERALADQFTFNMLSSLMLGLQVSNGKGRELGIVLRRVQGSAGQQRLTRFLGHIDMLEHNRGYLKASTELSLGSSRGS